MVMAYICNTNFYPNAIGRKTRGGFNIGGIISRYSFVDTNQQNKAIPNTDFQ